MEGLGKGYLQIIDQVTLLVNLSLVKSTSWSLQVKYPRYAAQTLPQAKLGTFDFLKTKDEKKLHEMSEDFTLYALEFIALLNEQNTIFKVVIGGAAVELLLQ